MKVLVTGSAGFIGSHLVKALQEQGHKTTGFDAKSGVRVEDGVGGDYDAIYHLAAMRIRDVSEDPVKAVGVNIKGTVNVLECAKQCDAKVIFSSASSVYGEQKPVTFTFSSAYGDPDLHVPHFMPVREDAPLGPVSVYGATKAASEVLIKAYHRQFGVDYVIFRFSNVYGPGKDTGVIPSFLRGLRDNEEITIYGLGEQTRDFVYVDDVVHFLVRALELDKENLTLNLGSGVGTSVNELLRMCEDVVGKEAKVKQLTAESEERGEFRADITKLKDVFGEIPQTSLGEGLRRLWGEM